MSAPAVADLHLVLVFTEGRSLSTWKKTGMLEREVALYRRLAREVGRVTFVTWGGREDRRIGGELGGIRVVANGLGLPWRWYRRSLRLRLAGRLRGPTILKSNQVRGADVAREAARGPARRFLARCGYLHSDFVARDAGPDSDEARAAAAYEAGIFRAADRVVVTADWMRERVVARDGIAPERVRVIPNYVDTETFRPAPVSAPEERRLLAVGRLSEQKNVLALIEALRGLPVTLCMVGDGPLRGQVEEAARAGGVPVEFGGRIPHAEVAAEIRRASVYLLPSLYEGHPKTLLEAMACGAAVVAGDVSGIREVVTHGENGWLTGTDPGSIRAGVETLLGDRDLRERLGLAARRHAVENYSLDRIVERELELYREMLSEPR